MLRVPIPFFTDNNVPDSVARLLRGAGHEVTLLRDCMLTDSADQVVATACMLNGYVLVSHDQDFKQLAKRVGVTQNQYRKRLHRIDLRCIEPESAARVQVALSLIDLEWSLREPGRPMVIEIRSKSILTHR